MLTSVPPSDCMLARESASARLDGELSELESARLDAHLRGCLDCRAYSTEIAAIAARIRAADLEQPARVTIPRRRRLAGARMQVAVAAAAAAVVAAVAGSSFTIGHAFGHRAPSVAGSSTGDLVSLRADTTLQHLLALEPARSERGVRPVRAGELEAV
jgi:predicted anti-sigma-YlaC factor YlaD